MENRPLPPTPARIIQMSHQMDVFAGGASSEHAHTDLTYKQAGNGTAVTYRHPCHRQKAGDTAGWARTAEREGCRILLESARWTRPRQSPGPYLPGKTVRMYCNLQRICPTMERVAQEAPSDCR